MVDAFDPVPPAIAKIENGDRSAKPLVDAGDALFEMGRNPYAVLFWRTAMRKPGNTPEQAAALKVRIDTALAEKLAK